MNSGRNVPTGPVFDRKDNVSNRVLATPILVRRGDPTGLLLFCASRCADQFHRGLEHFTLPRSGCAARRASDRRLARPAGGPAGPAANRATGGSAGHPGHLAVPVRDLPRHVVGRSLVSPDRHLSNGARLEPSPVPDARFRPIAGGLRTLLRQGPMVCIFGHF
jgi:hypothetical protein